MLIPTNSPKLFAYSAYSLDFSNSLTLMPIRIISNPKSAAFLISSFVPIPGMKNALILASPATSFADKI